MSISKNPKGRFIAASCLLASALAAQAQIGSGWAQVFPEKKIHLKGHQGLQVFPWSATQSTGCADYNYDSTTNIETFRLLQDCTNRSEIRFVNDYTSGKHQFEGEVRVSAPTNDESVMQVWGGNGGGATTQMIRAYADAGGSLRKNPGGVPLISGIYNTWVRVNVIHDVAANKVFTYINGTFMTTTPGQAPSSWYHKYGCYGTLRTGTAKTEWRNVKSFVGDASAETLRLPGAFRDQGLTRFPGKGSFLSVYDLTGKKLNAVPMSEVTDAAGLSKLIGNDAAVTVLRAEE